MGGGQAKQGKCKQRSSAQHCGSHKLLFGVFFVVCFFVVLMFFFLLTGLLLLLMFLFCFHAPIEEQCEPLIKKHQQVTQVTVTDTRDHLKSVR